VIAGLLLAVGRALAGSVAVPLKQRGAVAAPVVLACHPVDSAIGLFRSKWWTVGWLVALGAWLLHVGAAAHNSNGDVRIARIHTQHQDKPLLNLLIRATTTRRHGRHVRPSA
jgi:hypothetical protein